MLIPDESLAELKCSTCKNYLSYFPIYITNDSQVICGRCPLPKDEACSRNKSYEAIARLLMFPCRYKSQGCIEDLVPADVPHHEKVCSYKTIKCPTTGSTLCLWKGMGTDLLEHCETNHYDFVLKGEVITLDLVDGQEQYNIFKYDDDIFMVKNVFTSQSNSLWSTLIYFGLSNNNKKYFGRLVLENNSMSLTMPLQPDLGTSFDEKTPTAIIIESITGRSNNSATITGKIKISENEAALSCIQDTQHDEILSELKCSNCCHYLIPPVYQCVKGHSTCAQCSNRQCTVCPQENKDTNFETNKNADSNIPPHTKTPQSVFGAPAAPVFGATSFEEPVDKNADYNIPLQTKTSQPAFGAIGFGKPVDKNAVFNMPLHNKPPQIVTEATPLCFGKPVYKNADSNISLYNKTPKPVFVKSSDFDFESVPTKNLLQKRPSLSKSASTNPPSFSSESISIPGFNFGSNNSNVNIPNSFLDRIIKLKKYPCEYSKYGCSFTSKPEEILGHEEFCIYGPRNCPLKDVLTCNWNESWKTIASHIHANHQEIILKSNVISIPVDVSSRTAQTSCYVLKSSGHLFKLYFQYRSATFAWAMQLIDTPEKWNKFKFEIDILDNTNKNQKIYFRSLCSPLSNFDQCIQNGRCITMSLQQVKPFICINLTYRVNILK